MSETGCSRGHIEVLTPYGGALVPFTCPFCVIDQLTEQIKLKSFSTSAETSLAEFCRVRYARETEQWRANHDRRKQERDDLRSFIEEYADDPCEYADSCPSSARHYRCLSCKARAAIKYAFRGAR